MISSSSSRHRPWCDTLRSKVDGALHVVPLELVHVCRFHLSTFCMITLLYLAWQTLG